MTNEELVRQKWTDAKIMKAHVIQKDKTRRWMYCVESLLKSMASRGKKKRVTNVGTWKFSEEDAWADAAQAKGE